MLNAIGRGVCNAFLICKRSLKIIVILFFQKYKILNIFLKISHQTGSLGQLLNAFPQMVFGLEVVEFR